MGSGQKTRLICVPRSGFSREYGGGGGGLQCYSAFGSYVLRRRKRPGVQ